MIYTHIHDPEVEEALKSFRQAEAVNPTYAEALQKRIEVHKNLAKDFKNLRQSRLDEWPDSPMDPRLEKALKEAIEDNEKEARKLEKKAVEA